MPPARAIAVGVEAPFLGPDPHRPSYSAKVGEDWIGNDVEDLEIGVEEERVADLQLSAAHAHEMSLIVQYTFAAEFVAHEGEQFLL